MPSSPGRMSAGSGDDYRFSYGRFVVLVLGAGVVVLLICVPIVLVLAKWDPIAGLVAALLAVVAMITAIGFTSKYQIGKAERAMRAARGEGPPSS